MGKKLLKQFGGELTADLLERYEQSPNWNSGKFHNLEKTTMDINIQTLPKILYKQFVEAKNREPKDKIPVIPFDRDSFLEPSARAKFIWYGHSALLMRINGKTIFIDPMLGPNASPIAPFPTRRFSQNTLSIIDGLPPVDLVLMTHDHYDHLDLDSISRLKEKTSQYFVALGVGRHFTSWGVPESTITEFDWWDQQTFGEISITFTPTRHFSGRGLKDRARCLWGGWVLTTPDENIYFSGDGGYGPHFSEVGRRLGPFDIGFMECGQYNEHWRQIHMFPEDSVRAALDSGVQRAIPVHWGGFSLAQHTWTAPAERFIQEAQKSEMTFGTPRIGQQFTTHNIERSSWWEDFK